MSQNFLPCERDQRMLLAADMREWLAEDHLAWFVLDAVDEIDLTPFLTGTETTAGAAPPTTRT